MTGITLKSDFCVLPLNWRNHVKKKRGFSRAFSKTVVEYREDLIGKNVVVVGLGVAGRAAVKLALARGASVVGVDVKPDVPPLLVDSAVATRLRIELGPHKRQTFLDASRLVVSPGVPAAQPDIVAARQEGIPATSELSFAGESLPESVKVAAVSGTNGKSTVATFTGQLLRHAGLRTFVGGSHGRPLSEAALQCLAFPSEDPPFHAAVVSVSSYQMELPGTFCPKVAVILNLSPDHLERHITMEKYGQAKCGLFANMDSSCLAIIPQADELLRKLAFGSGHKATKAWLGGLPGVQLDSQARRAFVLVPTTGERAGLYLSSLKTIGSHNAHNAGTAALLSLALDLDLDEGLIQSGIQELQPPPHRMEIVYQDEQDVIWVNDSKATNVVASCVGLKGIIGRKAVVLLGGLAKVSGGESLGFDQLVNILESHRAVILFGASANQIEKELLAAKIGVPCIRTSSMKDAIEMARKLVKPGDAVILSPACASFDEFQNFEHRGVVFTDLAKTPVQ